MDLDLKDRVYVVTGGSRGLGRATADVLVAEGARLVVSARSQEALGAVAAALDREVYGGFVDLKSEDPPPDTQLERAELPELDNGPHFFYGLQWWFFGVLAIVGFGYLAFDEWRKRDRPE